MPKGLSRLKGLNLRRTQGGSSTARGLGLTFSTTRLLLALVSTTMICIMNSQDNLKMLLFPAELSFMYGFFANVEKMENILYNLGIDNGGKHSMDIANHSKLL